MKTPVRLLLGSAALAALLAPLGAQAQEAGPAAPAAPAAAAPVLGEVIVTARRRAERLQDVPVAVTVLSGDAVRSAGVQRFEDLQRAVPALQLQGGSYGYSTPAFTIRSQRNSDNTITTDPSVSVYFAEVPLIRGVGTQAALYDLGSVQVLKGPQGTLFGRNTTGGAIVLTPNAPSDKFEGFVTGTVGNYATRNLEAAVNLPLNDWAQLRLAGQVNRHKGYLRNLRGGRADDADNSSWRASLRLTPTDNIRNTTVLSGFFADEATPAFRVRFGGPIASLVFPNFLTQVAQVKALPFYQVNLTKTPRHATRAFTTSNITQVDVGGGVSLKNIFGYRKVYDYINFDLDGAPDPVYEVFNTLRSRQVSDELQLLGKSFDNHLDWILGAFYIQEKGSERNVSHRPGVVAGRLSGFSVSTPTVDIKNTSKSLFAQGTLRVPGIEKLSVTAGGRYTWDNRKENQFSVGGGYDPVTGIETVSCLLSNAGVILNPCFRHNSKDFSAFTYTLAADYKITDRIMVYATHRKGYRSGGWNERAHSSVINTPFSPEKVKDYEVGLKSEFAPTDGIQARFNVAAYYQDYRDIQRTVGFLDANGLFAGSKVQNAARAHIKGIEPELTLSFGRTLVVNGYYAYSKANYVAYSSRNATGGLDNLTDSPFAGAPRHSGGINVTVNAPVDPSMGEVRLIGNYYAQSKTFGNDNTYTVALGVIPYAILPHYHLINARLEWNHIQQSGLSAALFARNLTKEHYYSSAIDTLSGGLGFAGATIGEPRTLGLELNYRW